MRRGRALLAGVGMLREVIGFHPYRKSFDEIARRLERGDAFAETLARFPDLYDRKLTALVRVGEQTNRLPEMLRRQGETSPKNSNTQSAAWVRCSNPHSSCSSEFSSP